MKVPPQLPEFVAARMIRTARIDGWLLLVVAASFSIIAVFNRDFVGALCGSLATCAGGVEVSGARQLSRRQPKGLQLLILAQGALLLTIIGYSAWRLGHPDYALMKASLPRSLTDLAAASGQSIDELLRITYPLTYVILIVVSLFYQGAMIWYYAKSKRSIHAFCQQRVHQP